MLKTQEIEIIINKKVYPRNGSFLSHPKFSLNPSVRKGGDKVTNRRSYDSQKNEHSMSSVARTCYFQQLFLEIGHFDKRILNCLLRGDNAEDLLLQSQVPCFAGSILWLGMNISAWPRVNGTLHLACFSAPQLSAHSCETHPQSTLQALDTPNDGCEGGQTAYSSYQKLCRLH